MRHEGFSFYGPRKSDEGADTDLIYNFCWPYGTEIYTEFNLETSLRMVKCTELIINEF